MRGVLVSEQEVHRKLSHGAAGRRKEPPTDMEVSILLPRVSPPSAHIAGGYS
jgi:hypothetical protein